MSNESPPSQPRHSPDAFHPISRLIEAVVKQGQAGFFSSYPHALLLIDNPGMDEIEASFQTITGTSSGPEEDQRDRLLRKLEGTAQWVFVLKKPKNKFASMITVGRSANNEMRLNVPSVSKFHAYFTHVPREGAWYLADANSSNGTFVDGAEVAPSAGKIRLESGALLRFGPDVNCQFFEPVGIWEMMQARLAETPSGGYPVLPQGDAGEEPAA